MKKPIIAMFCTGLFFMHHIHLSSATAPDVKINNNFIPSIADTFEDYKKQTATIEHFNKFFEINPLWLEGAIRTIERDLSIKNKPEAEYAITEELVKQLNIKLNSLKKTTFESVFQSTLPTVRSLINPIRQIVHNAVWDTYTRIQPLPLPQRKLSLPEPIQKKSQQKTTSFATTDKIPHDKTAEELFKDISTIPQEAQLTLNNPETGNIALSEYGIIFVNTIINLAHTIKKSLTTAQAMPDQKTINKIIELAHHPFLQNSDPHSPSLVFVSPHNINPFTSLFYQNNTVNFNMWNNIKAQDFKRACKFIHTKVNEFPTVTYYHEPEPVSNQEEKIEKEQKNIQEVPITEAPAIPWTKAQPKKVLPQKRSFSTARGQSPFIEKRALVPTTGATTTSKNIARKTKKEPYDLLFQSIHGWNPFNWDWKSIYSSAGALWSKLWSSI